MRAGEQHGQYKQPKTSPKVLAAALALTLSGCASSKTVTGEAQPLPSASRTATVPSIVTPTVRSHQPPHPGQRAVYFQPLVASLKDKKSQIVPAGVYKMVAEPGQGHSWTSKSGHCNPENADNFTVIPGISRITAFNLGRLGLPYALGQMSAAEEAKINYALLIAPGNKNDLTKDTCDPPNSASRIAEWLGQNRDKRFTILADARTAEDNHAGIRALYLDNPAIIAVNDQVSVCTSNLSHEAAWNEYKPYIFEPPIDEPRECPPGSSWVEWR